jgi:hypothetical protein
MEKKSRGEKRIKVPPQHVGTLTNAAQRENVIPKYSLPSEMTEF